jgi:purine-nucleoside phosphorylase
MSRQQPAPKAVQPGRNALPKRAAPRHTGSLGGAFLPGPDTVLAAAARLKKLSRLRPTLAMVLGSGFHHVLSELEPEVETAYARLPGFLPVGVSGHAGQLFIGRLGGTPVMVLSGRSHFYEGHSMEGVTFAVRALAAYGIRDLLLTNAAGGVNRAFRPGDFMLLTDHINLMGTNPLRGAPVAGLPRFVDLTCTYDQGLRRLLQRAGRQCGMKLEAGVYLAVSGPSYETPAEIRAFARLGADAVGMSTVPEAIVARQCGLRVAAVSCITNLAAGRSRQPLSHAEVLETAERVKTLGGRLLRTFANLYARHE